MVQRSATLLLPDKLDSQWNDVFLKERILYEGIQQQTTILLCGDDGDDNINTANPTSFSLEKVDLVKYLPYDLVCSIFLQLPLKDFLNCIRVSCTWRNLILSTPMFWQHLRLCDDPRPPPNHIINLYLSHLQGAPLLSLCIHNVQDAETLWTKLCQTNCKQLYELDCSTLQGLTKESWFFFRQTIISAGKTLRILRLGSCNFKLDEIIDLISETCTRLEVFDLNNCFATNVDSTTTSLGYHDGESLQQLEHFGGLFSETDMKHMASLPSLPLCCLRLSRIHGLTAIHLAAILLRCPYLIELTLENSLVNITPVINILRYSCPRLEQLHYHRSDFSKLPVTEPSSPYRTATILPDRQQRWHRPPLSFAMTTGTVSVATHSNHNSSGGGNTNYHTTESHRNNHHRSLWKQLSLKQTRSLTDDFLHFILEGSFQKVERLDLTGNTQLTDNCIFNMIQQPQNKSCTALPNLVECSFANCANITELGLCLFIEHTPQLRQLDLSGLSGVTDVVLSSLALHCPLLSKLYLCRCRSITDAGIRCFIDNIRPCDKAPKVRRILQELDLTKTNISVDCLAYVMCHTQQNGI
ncbi:hypothetical protein BC941DRAFT_437882 [Chlamydoabsidia padenii]|nr:hypothetical protein BC941DRAFT_437882 [Chlamydoabsidia padenii]